MSFNNNKKRSKKTAWKDLEEYMKKDENAEFNIDVRDNINSKPRKLLVSEVKQIKSECENFERYFLAGYEKGCKDQKKKEYSLNFSPILFDGELVSLHVAFQLGYYYVEENYKIKQDGNKQIRMVSNNCSIQ